MAASQEPLRGFMKLPAELRLMVYSFLPIQTTHTETQSMKDDLTRLTLHNANKGRPLRQVRLRVRRMLRACQRKQHPTPHTPNTTLIRHHVSVQILRFCKTINREARDVMGLMTEIIRQRSPAFIIRHADEFDLQRSGIIFTLLMPWLNVLLNSEKVAFRTWLTSLPPTMTALVANVPEPILHFAEQAGIQMLHRYRRLEMFDPLDQIAPGYSSMFLKVTTISLCGNAPDDCVAWKCTEQGYLPMSPFDRKRWR